MAPSTRLRARLERRVNYAESAAPVGTRANPVRLEDTPEPLSSPEPTAPSRKATRKSTARISTARPKYTSIFGPFSPDHDRVTRVRAGAVVKPTPERKATEKAAKSKKKEPPAKRECSICATTKVTAR